MNIEKLYAPETWDPEDTFDPIVQSTFILREAAAYIEEDATLEYARRGNLFIAHDSRDDLIKAAAHFEPRAHLEEPEAWIHHLAVHPDFQRQGIGTEMISYFGTYCLDRRIKTIKLHPSPSSIPFYVDDNGFTLNRMGGGGYIATKKIVDI
ncbi:GNAT family N-acetyltransferase [Candidatus Saccharibacteria bacterium]|nr:GNAT family N-acetyltransferase [Candidatus Saccharibacteria bacterium]